MLLGNKNSILCNVHVHASHANHNRKVTMNPFCTTMIQSILQVSSFFLSVLEGSKGNWWSSIEVQVEVIIIRQREPEVIYPGYLPQYISKWLINQCNLFSNRVVTILTSHATIYCLVLKAFWILLEQGGILYSLVKYCARTDGVCTCNGVILSFSIYYKTHVIMLYLYLGLWQIGLLSIGDIRTYM